MNDFMSKPLILEQLNEVLDRWLNKNKDQFFRQKDKAMLILTRRINENLMIGDDVTVKVLDVKGNQVRIGINAPTNLSVHLYE